VVAVHPYVPGYARDAVCTDAVVPAFGVVLVEADPPDSLTAAVYYD
jgi:hypothetical protein